MRPPAAGLCLALVLSGCRESAQALGPTPAASSAHADALLTALAARFGPMELDPAFDALRPKLVRAALVPSRVFDDASAWTHRAGETREVEFAGSRAGGRYRMALRAGVAAPVDVGEYRGLLKLGRLGRGRFEWRVREELAVGGIRGRDLVAAATQLFRATEKASGGEARASAREALPRSTAAFGRLFGLEELGLDHAADGATAVTLVVRLRPEGIERDFPNYARFLRNQTAPVSFRIEALEPGGTRWWTAEGAKSRVSLRFRVAGGDLVPLDGGPRSIPRRLRLRVDYTMRPGVFGVGLRGMEGELELFHTDAELGFRTRFTQPPDWRLPFIIEPFLRASLRFPFEGEGLTLAYTLREQGEPGSLLLRDYRLGVRESWIVRWLGALTGSAVSEFRRGAEPEAERFCAECLEALRADLLALIREQEPVGSVDSAGLLNPNARPSR